jgi:carboxyl-terminal processing protease
VEGPLAGSPAEEAGVLAGEVLLEVDFYRADLLAAADVEALLRGPASSGALLRLRGADGAERELYVERRPLPQPAVREVLAGALLSRGRLLRPVCK